MQVTHGRKCKRKLQCDKVLSAGNMPHGMILGPELGKVSLKDSFWAHHTIMYIYMVHLSDFTELSFLSKKNTW